MDIATILQFRQKIRIIEREFEKQIKGCALCGGVSLAQCHALLELGQNEELSIAELADRLHLDRSTLSRTVDSLVQAGLVHREINPQDRRYMRIRLTQKGKEIVDEINTGSNRFYMKVFEVIPPEKHSVVIEGIGLFAEALEKVQLTSPEPEETPCCSSISNKGNKNE